MTNSEPPPVGHFGKRMRAMALRAGYALAKHPVLTLYQLGLGIGFIWQLLYWRSIQFFPDLSLQAAAGFLIASALIGLFVLLLLIFYFLLPGMLWHLVWTEFRVDSLSGEMRQRVLEHHAPLFWRGCLGIVGLFLAVHFNSDVSSCDSTVFAITAAAVSAGSWVSLYFNAKRLCERLPAEMTYKPKLPALMLFIVAANFMVTILIILLYLALGKPDSVLQVLAFCFPIAMAYFSSAPPSNTWGLPRQMIVIGSLSLVCLLLFDIHTLIARKVATDLGIRQDGAILMVAPKTCGLIPPRWAASCTLTEQGDAKLRADILSSVGQTWYLRVRTTSQTEVDLPVYEFRLDRAYVLSAGKQKGQR